MPNSYVGTLEYTMIEMQNTLANYQLFYTVFLWKTIKCNSTMHWTSFREKHLSMQYLNEIK